MNISYQPDGYTTVAPWILTDNTGAFLDFVADVFDGEELARVPTEDGGIGHGEIRVGDTIVLAFDRAADWPELPSMLRVWVPDADATVARALRAGSSLVTQLSNNAFGQRGARVRDPFGNVWWIDTQVEDVNEQVMWERLGEEGYAEDMRIAQETLDAELSGRSQGRRSAPVILPPT